MDLGDFANYRSGKQAEEAAEEAAEAAKANSRKIQNLQNSISQQQAAHEHEKEIASGLYELTIELDEDFRLLTDEPTEEAAERIANRYIRNPIDEFIDHNNHLALEYKDLASKTKETYDQLTGNTWFKRGASKVYVQLNKEAKIVRKEKEAREAREAARVIEKNVSRQGWGAALSKFFIILIIICIIFVLTYWLGSI